MSHCLYICVLLLVNSLFTTTSWCSLEVLASVPVCENMAEDVMIPREQMKIEHKLCSCMDFTIIGHEFNVNESNISNNVELCPV